MSAYDLNVSKNSFVHSCDYLKKKSIALLWKISIKDLFKQMLDYTGNLERIYNI